MKRFLFVLFVFSAVVGYGQDIHYSQFYNAPLVLNPAKTGIFNGDRRMLFSYKNQWSSVPVPWRTFTGSYDMKFYPKNSNDHFFSGGVVFNYDRQGDSRLSLTNLNLLGSYTRILNENNLLTFGLTLGYASRGFDGGSLTWDSQWDGTVLNTSLPGETINVDQINFIENALGINYRWQKSSRTKLDIGLGAYHFIEPNVAFTSNDIKLPRRINLTGVGSFQLSDDLDIQLNALAQYQGEFEEYIIGGLFKYHLDQTPGNEWQLHAGLGYRTRKTLFPTVALQHKNMYVSASYDIDLSEFDEHTNNRGGFEIHFRYIWAAPPAPRRVKVCPIF